MKLMVNQKGIIPIVVGVLVGFVLLAGISGLFFSKKLVWRQQSGINFSASPSVTPTQYGSPKDANTDETQGCSHVTASNVNVDPNILSEARAAFIAKGFTGSWLDKHTVVKSVDTHTNISEDQATGWKPQNEKITLLLYRVCVNEYSFQIGYDHSDDGKTNSFAEIYSPTHDINQVLTTDQAKAALSNCGAKLFGKPNVVFQNVSESGALFPNQTRLYMQDTVVNNDRGLVPPKAGTADGKIFGGIVTTQTANVDLESGKCFITTQRFGI